MKTTKLLLLLIFTCVAFNLLSDRAEPIVSPRKNLPTFLRISGGWQQQFHFKGSSNNDPNIPDQFEDISIAPSIHDFFDNGGGLRFSIDIKQPTSRDRAIIIGYEYEQSKLTILDHEFEILGEELNIKSHVPYFCFGTLFNQNFGFVKLGIPLMTYTGEREVKVASEFGETSKFTVKTHYKDTVAIRIGAGLEGKLHKGLRMLIGADLNILSTRPEKASYSLNGENYTILIDSDNFEDTHLSIYVQLTYQFKLR